MSNVVDFLTGNLILNLSILAWAIAQVLKFVITLISQGKLDWRHILSSGECQAPTLPLFAPARRPWAICTAGRRPYSPFLPWSPLW